MDFTNTELNANGGERVDKLLRYINARIEEKFKGFRQAFRNFDKDFGGSIDFKEFIEGMESIGVRLKLNDFRLVFERIDFDGKGIIDFQKFCLLNSDKRNELEQMVILTLN
jgi:Ca2+-binding EF-hand superfamily protein